MDYIEFKLWVGLAIVVAAFFAGLFGLIPQEPKEGRGKRLE